MSGWVKPGAEFTLDLHISNLSKFESGQFRLLRLPPDHYHRLGGGKPLGFGSIRLEFDMGGTDVRDGADWERWYSTFTSPEPEPGGLETLRAECTQAFEQTVEKPTVPQTLS